MKIMQILPHMNVGGVERGVLDLARYFKKRIPPGEPVTNIVVSAGGRLVADLEREGIGHHQLPVHKKSPISLLFISKLRKIIEKEKVDIVHARSRIPGWIAFFASRRSRAHFITTAHGVYRNKFFSEVMGWGKFTICPSQVVARHMKGNFGVPEEKIDIINRWVDLDRFKFNAYDRLKDSNTIVSIGRISPTKGYEYLIEGFKKVVRVNPYCKLRIVGSAGKSKMRYLDHLKTLTSRFSLNYNIEFSGFRPDIENVLSGARILVAPSVIEESFGRVVIEAFACGVPVIATNVGGFSEIIDDGRNGILVEPKNSLQIADAILKLLNDSGYARKLVNAAREKVEGLYAMEKSLNETEEIYKRALREIRILVIKLSSLGDLILALPALKVLREKFPQARISLLTAKKYHPLIYDCPYVDEIITLDGKYKSFKSILAVAKDLRRKSFDYIVDLQNSHASHLVSFLAFPRFSLGFALRLGFLLSKKVRYDRREGPLQSQEKILKLLGVQFTEKRLVFWPREGDPAIALPEGELIGINVSASSKWESKNWPLKNITKLAELIYKTLPDAAIILFGDKAARDYAQRIEAALKFKPLNLCGKTNLKDLPLIIKKLRVFITPDTATLHLASSLGVATLALFGPTDPQRHTVSSKNLYIFSEKIACSFCYQPRCRSAEKNLCLEKITPQQVFSKVKEILGAPHSRAGNA